MKKFHKVNIEISNICNLQCSFCPEVVRHKKLMEIDLFTTIIEQVAPLTEQVCFHLMGEPLLHPKLGEFLEICRRHAVPVNIVSNGVLLTAARATLLLSPIVRQVNFSLHSFADNFPDQSPDIYLDKIFTFVERAFIERPELYLNFRLWNLNEPNLLPAAHAQNQAVLSKIATRFGILPELPLDLRRQKSLRLLNRLYLHFDTEFTWPALDLPWLGQQGYCHGLTGHFGILADGTVVPCCLDKEGVIPLGQVGKQPLIEILTSARAQSMVKGFRERRLVETLCQHCQFIERFN